MRTSASPIMKNHSSVVKLPSFVIFFQVTSFLFCSTVLVQASPTIRYLHGRLELEKSSSGLLETHSSSTVSEAWKHCQHSENCVSFGFQATARYPGANVTVAYYSVADWHIPSHLVESEPFFVPDDTWHLYVNTTREQAMVATEVQQTLAKLKALDVHGIYEDKAESLEKSSSGRLRSRVASSDTDASASAYNKRVRLLKAQEKAGWLLGLFGIAKYKALRLALIPTLTRPLIQIASDNDEMDEIRTIALEIILALTDSYETPVILQGEYNLLAYLQAIIQPPNSHGQNRHQKATITWGIVNSMALDLISNMALHGTKSNPFVIPNGLWDLLQQISQAESGSAIGLQASLALIHLWGTGMMKGVSIDSLPKSTLLSLLELLEATIDGDPVYGYDWDLMPGPLSAIQLLVTNGATGRSDPTAQSSDVESKQSENSDTASMVDILLNAGLVEQLTRILDSTESSLPSALTTLATLEILQCLRILSRKAEIMVALVAATSIDATRRRLQEYETVQEVAQSLAKEVASHKLHQGGGWMMDEDDGQEL
ncbi:unnamed protein product [Cylindrotheca closterium]|uniref:Uncharacterized protein n=1 Tax=Cylindrotheca closterium TaxID=2856 RepID=A0AAD2FSE3_9STRA|nr:unnamed protein product [Cylindrotheca closterium]